MAEWVKLLHYQMLAFWRRAFSIRGKYDASAGFLLLILAAFAFRYISILKGAAKSLANGGAENLNLIFAIVFLAWIPPALERQSVSAQTGKFLHLPLTKTRFAFINLAAVFLLPTSVIALIISLAATYPFVFSKNAAGNVITLFLFVLFSAFTGVAFINLIKMRFFRIALFLSSITFAFLYFSGELNFILKSEFLPAQTISRNIVSKNSLGNVLLVAPFLFAAFLLAFFSVRQTIFASAQTKRILNPRLMSRIRFPLKFGEMVKKDFVYSWKLPDCWLSLPASIFYAILLAAGDFSFESFSVAISVIVMLCGSLAFNVFGLESSSGIERLSLFPIKPEDLLKTKNKTFALLIFSNTFFLFPLVFFKFGAILLLVSILKIVSIVLLYTAWGNHLSIKYPFQMRFYQLSFGGSLSAIMYGVLAISLLIIAPEILTAGQTATKLIANILLIIFTLLIYRFFLRRSSQKLSENWCNIAFKLS
jgi:hypothetical protein